MEWLHKLFNTDKPLIGMVHLLPLPGSPMPANWNVIMERVEGDVDALVSGGAEGIMLENFGDSPYFPGQVEPVTIACMTKAACRIASMCRLPFGVNVLRNDALAALSIAHAVGAAFIRVNVLTGTMVTDQGIISGAAHALLRERARLGAEVKIFADVLVKHAQSLGGRDIVQSGMETAFRGLADALIVTGTQTGLEADPLELEKLQNVLPDVPVFVGSGITPQNVARFRRADGFIAGTSLKVDGVTTNQVDIVRVKKLECAISSMRP